MRNKLRLQAKVGEMFLNLPTNERAQETKALSLTGVNLDDFL